MSTAGFQDLDRTIHEGARLAIMSMLAGADEVSFVDLRGDLGLTDGNLGAHLKTLEAAGFIKARRIHGDGRPTSYVSLTARGRASFNEYLRLLESIIGPARGTAPRRKTGRVGLEPG
jgi:DNA-binding MarR family transcriptional regulator